MRLAILTVFAALALSSCTPPPSGTVTPPPSPPTPPPAGGTACPATITTSSSNVYSPSSCTVKIGTPVTIEASGMHPLSGSGAGETVTTTTSNRTITFSSKGTFNFICGNHGAGGMKGTITVE